MQTEVNLAKVRMSNAGSPSFPWLSQIQSSTHLCGWNDGSVRRVSAKAGEKTDMVAYAPKYSMGV